MSVFSPRIDLFKFVESHQGKVYRLTNSNKSAFIGEEEYLPAAITRSAIQQTEELAKTVQEITLPISNDMARRWTFNGMENTVTLVIFSQKGSETKAIWRGRLSTVKPDQTTILLEFIDNHFRLQRNGLGATFTRNCRHSLYDEQCGVNKDDYVISRVVSTTDGQVINVPSALAVPEKYFSGGVLKTAGGSLHTILTQEGSTFTLMTKSSELLEEGANMLVSLYPGCDKTTNTCKSKFDNLPKFGGFPWIPNKDVYDGTAIQEF